LIIIAALDDAMIKTLFDLTHELDMDALIEVHNAEELERAKAINPAMVGVNNRNLKTLDVDIETSAQLYPLIPDHVIKVAESGISSPDTIENLHTSGYNAFLVGESLMRAQDIEAATRALLKK